MQFQAKAFIVALIPTITFALVATPANAVAPSEPVAFALPTAKLPEAPQSLSAAQASDDRALATLAKADDAANIPHGFNVAASIALAESEIGTSRPTGWNAPGECISSVYRWIKAGGGNWTGSGNPVAVYDGAARLTMADAQPGDIVQYEYIASPTSWATGVHTVLITERHSDGTFTIIESNNPGGSGLVSKNTHWTPAPPAGFEAVVWRF